MLTKFLTCIGIGLAAMSGMAQSSGDMLSSINVPPNIKIADLGSDYKAYRLKTLNDSAGLYGGLGGLAMMGGMGGPRGGDGAIGLFTVMDVNWTKQQVVTLGNSSFLVTYRAELGFPKGAVSTGTPTVTLRLVLLRTDTITSIEPWTDITKEDLSAALSKAGIAEDGETLALNLGTDTAMAAAMVPMSGNARRSAEAASTLSNIKQLSTGMMLYLTDNDDMFPYVQDTDSLRPILRPYLKNDQLWQVIGNPGARFLFNMSLAGVNATQIESPSTTVLFYESQPGPSGKRAVAQVDTSSKLVDANEWNGMLATLHLYLKRHGKPLPVKHQVFMR